MVALIKPDNLIDLPQSQVKNDEWYTPAHCIEAAREVMGFIELDPASCEQANRIVKAERYYTREQNGLERSWKARTVWLNPPYGRSNDMKARHKSTIEQFVMKLLWEYQSGAIGQAILLVPATIGTNWFHPLWQYPICFHTGKLNFLSPIKHTCYSHAYGTVLAYLGLKEDRFIKVFQRFGTIAKRVSQPKQPVTPLSLWGVSP